MFSYNQTTVLKEAAIGVECWNFTTGNRFDLPAGTIVRINYATDSTTTNISVVDEAGHPKAVKLLNNGRQQDGHRFIIDNVQLARITGLDIPEHTEDIVGDIIRYENGEMNKTETRDFFKRLKSDNILAGLQGHYQRATV